MIITSNIFVQESYQGGQNEEHPLVILSRSEG